MKRILTMTLLSLLMFFVALPVKAEELPENTSQGTIDLKLIVTDDENGNPINKAVPGASFSVYKIWYYDIENNVHIMDAFKSTGVEIDTEVMTNDEIQKTKDKFYEVLQNSSIEPDYTFTTDENGSYVGPMPYGGYLFVMDNEVVVENVKYSAGYFIGCVPEGISNLENDDYVEIFPKIVPVVETLPPPPIEKKVNGVDHYDLKEREEVVTYTITTEMPKFGTEFVVFDTLEPVLEFEPKAMVDHVTVEVGSYKLTKEELSGKNAVNKMPRVTIREQTITVDVSDWVKDHRSEKLVINFHAKIRKGADLSPYKDETIPNHATYSIDNKWTKDSNVVTIRPPKKQTPPPTPPKPPTPFTGDNFNIYMWVGLLVIALIAVAGSFSSLKKKK
ncbi:MAG: isopeptide-forming domain-containing fimbrial protein [Solobacterium sp.]|nr:isopeptide-forming domain-containing fimbrial protein [Solobacterium sp.]